MKPKPEKIADKRLRHDVEKELEYDSEITSTDIGVGAAEGIVTLTGYVDTYNQKLAAEHAAHRVVGVKAVANDLVIRPLFKITDTEIAASAVAVLKASEDMPVTIEVTVKDGHVYLDGTATSTEQSKTAENLCGHLAGVTAVFNRIAVRASGGAAGIKEKIESSFLHNAELDARALSVTVLGNTVELWGNVRNLSEKDDAERAAWSAPGVEHVRNHLQILP